MACNYDGSATNDDGSCDYSCYGCTDPTALNTDTLANTNSGCIYPSLGCTDPDACNNGDTDNECTYPEDNYNCDGVPLLFEYNITLFNL